MLGPVQVCDVLDISYGRFLQLCHSGELRATWGFTSCHVTEHALEEYIATYLPETAGGVVTPTCDLCAGTGWIPGIALPDKPLDELPCPDCRPEVA